MKNSPLSGKALIQLIVLVVFFSSNFFSASAQQKVVGGIDVDIKDYPWQVAVDYGCGGSIIGDSWVLTAAHCVGGGVNYIYAGNSAPYASGGETYTAIQTIVHPSYGSGTSYSHDFALVEIEGEFNFSNPNIGKIDLINAADVLAGSEDPGVMATITGWGTLSSGGSMASTLQMVQAPIVANDVACGAATDENGNSGDYGCSSLDGSMICAGDLINGGEDACQGDSGGPLAVRSVIDNRWLLIGATSWGYGCADVNYPGVWSRVSYVLDWIDDNADVNSEYGCMDVAACNYSDEAIYDVPESCIYEIDECGDCGGDGPTPGYDCDGNCVTGETLNITMSDSYGDGWNGNTLTIGDAVYGLDSGSEGSDLASCAVPGCTDENATNYNPAANVDDASCEYALVQGCTDATACNYDAAAEEDDGSCTYAAEGFDCDGNCLSGDAVTINMFDSYGDGGGSVTVGGVTATNSGSSSSTVVCVDLSACNTVDYEATDSWSYENSWSITDASGAELALGADEDGEFGDCVVDVPGCTDSSANNFNADANVDDGSCNFSVPCPAVDFSFVNTGVNMTLFAPNGVGLSGTVGAFVGDMCIGSSESDGGPIQIAVMGNDTESPELDGALAGDIVTLILQHSYGIYVTETSFEYALNGIEVIENLSFDLRSALFES